MILTVVADPTYEYENLTTQAVGSVAGQFTPHVTFRWSVDGAAGPVVNAPGDRDTQQFTLRPTVMNRGTHIIDARAEDSSAPANKDASGVTVFTNREPTATILRASLSPDGSKILLRGTGNDPENELTGNAWDIIFNINNGDDVFVHEEEGLDKDLEIPWPVQEFDEVRVTVELHVYDDNAAAGEAFALIKEAK